MRSAVFAVAVLTTLLAGSGVAQDQPAEGTRPTCVAARAVAALGVYGYKPVDTHRERVRSRGILQRLE